MSLHPTRRRRRSAKGHRQQSRPWHDPRLWQLALTDIVKGGEQTFCIDMYLNLYWTDQRLDGAVPEAVVWDDVWRPTLEITNAM